MIQELKLKYNGEINTYKIPQGWNDVTVGQYIKSLEVCKKEGLSDIEMMIELLEVFANIPSEFGNMIPLSTFTELIETMQFINTDIEEDLVEKLEIGGEEYFLLKDFQSLSLGEIISIEHLSEKFDDLTLAIPELLCIFLRKKLENGDLEDFNPKMMERTEMFNDVMIQDVFHIFFYFSGGENILLKAIKESSEKREKGIEETK